MTAPKLSLRVRRAMVRFRAAICARCCPGAYDRQAGEIVDVALAEIDRLHAEIDALRDRDEAAP